ncbi:uncharacterized protein [Miscanthus floridulus]|uniref:uncharacterized protein n=1 Tax=Miscanthus floridulus TaxID=154761 RepID=UPI00345A66E6
MASRPGQSTAAALGVREGESGAGKQIRGGSGACCGTTEHGEGAADGIFCPSLLSAHSTKGEEGKAELGEKGRGEQRCEAEGEEGSRGATRRPAHTAHTHARASAAAAPALAHAAPHAASSRAPRLPRTSCRAAARCSSSPTYPPPVDAGSASRIPPALRGRARGPSFAATVKQRREAGTTGRCSWLSYRPLVLQSQQSAGGLEVEGGGNHRTGFAASSNSPHLLALLRCRASMILESLVHSSNASNNQKKLAKSFGELKIVVSATFHWNAANKDVSKHLEKALIVEHGGAR